MDFLVPGFPATMFAVCAFMLQKLARRLGALAGEANDRFIVRPLVGPTEYKVAARHSRAMAALPSDRWASSPGQRRPTP